MTGCNQIFEPIEIYFYDDLQVEPVEVDFRRDAGKFDFLQAELPPSEARKMYEAVEGGAAPAQRVEVRAEDKVLLPLYFQPDFFEMQDHGGRIELRDLRSFLSKFTVEEKQFNSTNLEKMVNNLIEDVPRFEYIFNGVKFNIPATSQKIARQKTNSDIDLFNPEIPDDQPNQVIPDIAFTADINKATILEAFQILNNKFGLRTWVDKEATLRVGRPEGKGLRTQHIGAMYDDRVWKIKDINIEFADPAAAVGKIVVNGPKVSPDQIADDVESDESFSDSFADGINQLKYALKYTKAWYNPNTGFGVKAQGVAKIKNNNYGPKKVIDRKDVTFTDAKIPTPKWAENKSNSDDGPISGYIPDLPDFNVKEFERNDEAANAEWRQLDTIAKSKLLESVTSRRAGSVTIAPKASGTEYTDYMDLEIGDTINIFTPTAAEAPCKYTGPTFGRKKFIISGYHHNTTGAKWDLQLQLKLFPSFEIESNIRFVDMKTKEKYKIQDNLLERVT